MYGGCGKEKIFIKKGEYNLKLKRLLIICAVFTLLILIILFYKYYSVYNIEKLDIKVEVGEGVGLDVSKDYVGFGIVSHGNSAARDIILSHSYDKNLMIKMHVEGELRDWIVFSENNFFLEPGAEKKVGVSLFVPKEASKGKYESELIVVYKKII